MKRSIVLKDLFPAVDSSVLAADDSVRAMPHYSKDYSDRCKSYFEAINKDIDIINPRRVDGSRQSDVETLMSTNNQMVYNMIAGNFKPVASPNMQQDPSMSDSQREQVVTPRNTIASDVAHQFVETPVLSDVTSCLKAPVIS